MGENHRCYHGDLHTQAKGGGISTTQAGETLAWNSER